MTSARPRPLRPCAEPRCPALVRSGRCVKHARPIPERQQRRKDPEQARFYGSVAWKKMRAETKREQPICAICRVRPTKSVDHADGNWRNNARSNRRGLCEVCEPSRTGRQHSLKRRKP